MPLELKQKYYHKPFRRSQKEFKFTLCKIQNLMVIGDLNVEVNLECMKHFCETYDLESLNKVPTCYKNPENP